MGTAFDLGDDAITITVAYIGGAYLASIDMNVAGEPRDSRTLTSTSCSDLADAMAVIVAGVAKEHFARIIAAPALELPPPREIEELPDEPDDSRHYGVRVSVLGGIGVVSDAAVGGELVGYGQLGHLRGEIGGAHWLSESTPVEAGSTQLVNVALDVATIRVGWQFAPLPVRIWGGTEFGDMRGSTSVAGQVTAGSSLWVAAGGGVGGVWRLADALGLVVAAEGMIALASPRFTSGDGATIYASNPLTMRLLVGLELGW